MASDIYRRARMVTWILGVALVSALTLLGQGKQQLYLVTGFAANNAFNIDVPSTLLAIDEGKSQAVKVLDLADGTGLILADQDRRLVLIGSFRRLVEIDMNSPTKPRTIFPTSGLQFLCTPPNSAVEEGCASITLPEHRVSGVALTGGSAGEHHDLPFSYYRFVRTERYWSPVDPAKNGIFLFLKNGKLLFHPNEDAADLGIPLPSNPASFVNATNILLAVSNDDMFVIDCYRRPTREGQAETHSFQIYDKKFRTWQSINLDAGPSVRGFGPWVATTSFVRKRPIGVGVHESDLQAEAESPGATFRKRILNPKARERHQTSLEVLFQQVPFQFTGDLHLYNIRSGLNLMIRTGQGDSEILLVDGNTVYYRVNDTLYKAPIAQKPEQNSVKILTDPAVQFGHWAFMGPPFPAQ